MEKRSEGKTKSQNAGETNNNKMKCTQRNTNTMKGSPQAEKQTLHHFFFSPTDLDNFVKYLELRRQ